MPPAMFFRKQRNGGKIEIEQQQLGGKNGKASFKTRGGKARKVEKFTCLDIAFKNSDQLKTNTALQMEAVKIEFKVI